MGRTKTMHVAPHVSQVVVPRLHGLRAPWWPPSWHPPRAKTAKVDLFPPRRARLPGHIWDFHIIKFEFFSETLRAHAAPGAACALKVSEATDNFKIGKSQISPQPSQLHSWLGPGLKIKVRNSLLVLLD